uniref:Uncharacterized protein n=1 Tax=Romanomermis culicivorax TaxID=13658 RepID=A0A915KUH9_ROMCU
MVERKLTTLMNTCIVSWSSSAFPNLTSSGLTPRGGSCVAISDGRLDGNPVGGNGRGGNVGAIGGWDVIVGRIEGVADVAGSTSMGGGGSGTLNTSFGGFFKASRRL